MREMGAICMLHEKCVSLKYPSAVNERGEERDVTVSVTSGLNEFSSPPQHSV
jgi:hypothetical protein